MKLVDIFHVHPRYRTKEELIVDPTVKDTKLENILTSDSIQTMGTSARLASEEALKVRVCGLHSDRGCRFFCILT